MPDTAAPNARLTPPSPPPSVHLAKIFRTKALDKSYFLSKYILMQKQQIRIKTSQNVASRVYKRLLDARVTPPPESYFI
jgi:hypothetical protein